METPHKKPLAARIKLFGLIAGAVASVLAASNSSVQLWQNTDAGTHIRRVIDELIHPNPIKQVEQSTPQKAGISPAQKRDQSSKTGKK